MAGPVQSNPLTPTWLAARAETVASPSRLAQVPMALPQTYVPSTPDQFVPPSGYGSAPVISIVARDAEAAAETAASEAASRLERWSQSHPKATTAQLDQQVKATINQLATAEHPGRGRVPVTDEYRRDAAERLARHVQNDGQHERLVAAVTRAAVQAGGGLSIPTHPNVQQFIQNLQVLQQAVAQAGSLTASERAEVDQAFQEMDRQLTAVRELAPGLADTLAQSLHQAQAQWRQACDANPPATPVAPTTPTVPPGFTETAPPASAMDSETVDVEQYQWFIAHRDAYVANALSPDGKAAFERIANKTAVTPELDAILRGAGH